MAIDFDRHILYYGHDYDNSRNIYVRSVHKLPNGAKCEQARIISALCIAVCVCVKC